MPESQAANEPLLLEQWKQLRLEMNEVVSRCVELERYALLSTGAIWAWLATADVDWDPLLTWLPFLLNAFFALRALGLLVRTREIGASLVVAETHLAVPADLRLEKAYRPRSIKMLAMWAFWLLLLAATLVLPYFYVAREPDFDCDQRQTLTSRSRPKPSTILQRRVVHPGGAAEVSRAPLNGADRF